MILDTMLVSELTCLEASPKVVALVDKFDHEDLYTTTVTKAEILFGLAAMPAGKRRFELEKKLSLLILGRCDARYHRFRPRRAYSDQSVAAKLSALST